LGDNEESTWQDKSKLGSKQSDQIGQTRLVHQKLEKSTSSLFLIWEQSSTLTDPGKQFMTISNDYILSHEKLDDGDCTSSAYTL